MFGSFYGPVAFLMNAGAKLVCHFAEASIGVQEIHKDKPTAIPITIQSSPFMDTQVVFLLLCLDTTKTSSMYKFQFVVLLDIMLIEHHLMFVSSLGRAPPYIFAMVCVANDDFNVDEPASCDGKTEGTSSRRSITSTFCQQFGKTSAPDAVAYLRWR